MISQTAEYALRAVLVLARKPEATFTAREIASLTGLPAGYLPKILRALVLRGIASARRGSRGGFRLARPADSVTILDVVNATDPIRKFERCPAGIEAHAKNPCPLHRRFLEATALAEKALSEATLKDLIEEEARRRTICGILPGKKP